MSESNGRQWPSKTEKRRGEERDDLFWSPTLDHDRWQFNYNRTTVGAGGGGGAADADSEPDSGKKRETRALVGDHF